MRQEEESMLSPKVLEYTSYSSRPACMRLRPYHAPTKSTVDRSSGACILHDRLDRTLILSGIILISSAYSGSSNRSCAQEIAYAQMYFAWCTMMRFTRLLDPNIVSIGSPLHLQWGSRNLKPRRYFGIILTVTSETVIQEIMPEPSRKTTYKTFRRPLK